ncbi:MAG: glycosyltransferase [Candidatus Accumulibacter sp.]|jgi:glycosyltransferase involved in cell wall biosynthesis|nr:glycosyltransferase [Accumulibacter sp.]
MKRILLLSGSLKLSGVVTWLLQIQAGFLAAGTDVAFLVTSKKTDIHPDAGRVFYTGRARTASCMRIARWLQLHRVFPRWYERKEDDEMNRRIEKILTSLAWQDRIDLIVKVWGDKIPSCLRKWPIVETIHSLLSQDTDTFKKLEKITTQKTDNPAHFIVPVGNVVAEDARNLGLSVAEVIHNPLNIEELERKSTLFTPQIDRPYIVFVGRLVNGKGVHELLQAFAALKADVDLVYVGDGSATNTLRETARALGVQDKVHFKGFLDNPYPWIRNARLLVLPSTTVPEAMGYAAVEACALGCGIVVSDFLAAREFFAEELIVPRLPVEGYVERLTQKISSGLAGELPLGIKPGVLEKIDTGRVVEKYLALIDKQGPLVQDFSSSEK